MKNNLFLYIAILFVIASCTKERAIEEIDNKIVDQIDESKVAYGFMRIKVDNALGTQLKAATTKSGDVNFVNVKSVNDPLEGLCIISMTRTFKGPEKFEARKREMGLDLWYDVVFDQSKPITKAHNTFSKVNGIEEVEYGYIATPEGLPFNDPRLADQWHYYNDGSNEAWKKGVDVNVAPTWEKYTVGNPDVIVAVVDGGIDYEHEDLKWNMWVNKAESEGINGKDDDGNNYTDDVYGYNFLTKRGKVTPERHGTHVAGTIAAVNNNGLGVGGVAGGDYAKGKKGVRLMSCQIFDDSEEDKSGNGAIAIVYAADNGAVICQNSWGYPDLFEAPISVKKAVDYFIKNAGMDENNQQTGPMAGGIVIFAAGNQGSEIYGSPASYEKCMAVASVGPTGAKASYSNYGAWVDISAPGGEAGKGTILSTLPDNSYGYMQGTSMACPHVSGVAALVVSYFAEKGKGFTAQALWDKLISGVNDVYKYNLAYRGKLGVGLVNAFAPIANSSTIAPNNIASISGDVKSNMATISVIVPVDADDDKPAGINIYYSTSPITSLNTSSLPENVFRKSFSVGDVAAGGTLNCLVDNLEFNTTYYFIADAYDYSGNKSELSSSINLTTGSNAAPIINESYAKFSLKAHETVVKTFTFSDPDGHPIGWEYGANSKAGTAMFDNGKLSITIVGAKDVAGVYRDTITVGDPYISTVTYLEYEILQNHAPVVLKGIDDMLFSTKGEKMQLNLAEYFNDEDGESLSYSIENSNNSVVHANPNEGILYITSLANGEAVIKIIAKDVLEEKCEISFKVSVYVSNKEIDVYPNPAKEFINIRPKESKTYPVALYNVSGAKVFESNINAGPFNPYKLDVTSYAAGVYTLKIGDYTISVTKL